VNWEQLAFRRYILGHHHSMQNDGTLIQIRPKSTCVPAERSYLPNKKGKKEAVPSNTIHASETSSQCHEEEQDHPNPIF